MHTDSEQYNPLRSLSWRFERALHLVDRPSGGSPAKCSFKDDDDTKQIRKYLIASRRLRWTQQRLINEFSGLYFAEMLYNSHPMEKCKHHLQARILARQKDHEIAPTIGTTNSTIYWYESAFFNVRDRLLAKDWIIRNILEISRIIEADVSVQMNAETQAELDRLTALKLFAFNQGSAVFEALMIGYQNDMSIEQIMDDSITMDLKRHTALTLKNMRLSAKDMNNAISSCLRLVEASKVSRAMGNTAASEKHVAEILKHFFPKLAVGSKGEELSTQCGLKEIDHAAVELRDSELNDPDAVKSPEVLAKIKRTRLKVVSVEQEETES